MINDIIRVQFIHDVRQAVCLHTPILLPKTGGDTHPRLSKDQQYYFFHIIGFRSALNVSDKTNSKKYI